MKYKVGDKVIFNQDCRLAFSYIPKGKTGEITDIVDTGLTIAYRIKMKDYPNATVPTDKADDCCERANEAPSITKRINDKHNILNGLLQTDGSVDLERLVSKLENNSAVHDNVNHPSHYTDGKIEVIDYIEDKKLGYHLGNACKYISRAGKKDAAKRIEDLQKAIWYISRQIELWGKEDKE